jgi:hypothetical protein
MERHLDLGAGVVAVIDRGNSTLPQLSCESCRERKVKCDKLEPCTNCVSAGLPCIPVHRMRRPRGRHVSRTKLDTENLAHRIRKLEAMINKATAMAPGSDGQLAIPMDVSCEYICHEKRTDHRFQETWGETKYEMHRSGWRTSHRTQRS